MQYCVYMAIYGENRIAIWTMDPETGHLSFREDVPLSGAPGPLAVDPERRYLYAGLRSTCQMASHRIDPATGALSLIGTIPLDSDPCYISTDRRGRFLFSAYYRAGGVAVHRIGTNGVVEAPPTQWLPTAPRAHCIQTDRTNRFAFVPHVVPSNMIQQFEFDEDNGKLIPNAVPRVAPKEEVGPRHFCFHPHQDWVYSSNEQGCSVTAYHFDARTGTLAPFQTVSTLPADYQGENTCSQIQIAPSGRFLYAPNRGHNSIACFSVDASTGALTAIGQQPSEQVPRAFTLDPDSRFLYAAGLESGRLASYRIDPQTGALEPLETYVIGPQPMWVLIVRLPTCGG